MLAEMQRLALEVYSLRLPALQPVLPPAGKLPNLHGFLCGSRESRLLESPAQPSVCISMHKQRMEPASAGCSAWPVMFIA